MHFAEREKEYFMLMSSSLTTDHKMSRKYHDEKRG